MALPLPTALAISTIDQSLRWILFLQTGDGRLSSSLIVYSQQPGDALRNKVVATSGGVGGV